ncbi:hypothetical protein AALB81_18390 [Lachnospiraceae bacterium 48-33]
MPRYPISEEEKRLMEIVEPYGVYNKKGGFALSEDAPEIAKKSLERIREIGKEQDELEMSLW